ncbi:MAG: Bug family tripartite tricarboxylate transporter substrate binding protein [Burkholderiales bacterium]
MRIANGVAVASALLLSAPAHAQDAWPSRSVRVIVPSSPGGGTDIYARLISHALSETFKQPFVVDNKPGASGNIGAEAAAKARPDGYTFLVSASPSLIINPSLYRDLPYSAERDFVAISRGVASPYVICIHPSLQAKSLGELLALGKREPGTLPFGSAGIGSATYLGVRVLEEASGARFLHVPYKGLGPAYKDLLGGQIKFMLADLASALPHIRGGKALALAVSERANALPGTPTFAEAGLPGVEIGGSFFGVVAPTGTPPAIVQRMSTEIVKAMKAPALAEKLEAQAYIPIFDTPELAAAAMKREREAWAAFIKRHAIVAEP